MHNILFLLFLSVLVSLPFVALGQDAGKQIDELIPKLADANFEARYAPQMAFRDLASIAGRPGAESERKAFVAAVLERLAADKTPPAAKVWFVRELEHIGKGESVDALGKLLASDDEELREVARRALQKNSDPSASDALLGALEMHDARWQSGIVNALGQRRADAATPKLKALLSNEAHQAVAARALGSIGSKDAVTALHGAWEGANPAFTQVLCKSMIAAAKQLPAAESNDLCEFLFNAPKTPVATRIAAWKRNYLANPTHETLLAGVQHQNYDISGAAIRAAAGNEEATTKLASGMLNMDEKVQVRVLGLLADHGTPAAAEVSLVKASESGNADVRRAAIQAMEGAGSLAVAQTLLKYAAAGDGDARRALTKIQGEPAQVAINSAMGPGDAKIRVAAINTLSDRRVNNASSLLIQMLANEKDAGVSSAAISVLGKIADGKDIPPLLQLCETNPRAIGALRNAANRADDKDGATKLVVDSLGKFDGKEKAAMLKILPVLGSDSGLKVLADAKDGDSMRALAEWPDGRAVNGLFANTGNADLSDGEHVTIVRGLIRLIPEAKMNPEKKVEMIGDLMTASRNEDLRKQVVTLYGDIHNPASAGPLVEVIKAGKYKDEANLAGVKLAEELMKQKKKAEVKSLTEAVLAAGATGQAKKKAEELLKRSK